MRILGIDPGTAITGYGIVDEHSGGRLSSNCYGAITTPASMAMPERLLTIATELRAIIETEQPDMLSIEQLFFNKNTRTALSVGQARGVVLYVAAEANLPITEFTPAQVKMAVTGHGRAHKQQVQNMVERILGLASTPRPDDTADALAVAICAHHSRGLLHVVAWK